MCDSWWPHGLQHTRLPCPSLFSSFSHVCWYGDAIQRSQPLSPPYLLLSNFLCIRVFSNELALHIRWWKYWRFSISPSNDYSRLISFRIDCFKLLAVQGTLKEFSPLPQFESINFSALSLFMGQLTHPYMTTGKTIALTIKTFVRKVMSLLCNALSLS